MDEPRGRHLEPLGEEGAIDQVWPRDCRAVRWQRVRTSRSRGPARRSPGNCTRQPRRRLRRLLGRQSSLGVREGRSAYEHAIKLPVI